MRAQPLRLHLTGPQGGGDVISPRSAVRGRVELTPVRGVRRQLHFLGVQHIPDGEDALAPIPALDQGGGSPVRVDGASQVQVALNPVDYQGLEGATPLRIRASPDAASRVDDTAPPGGCAEAQGGIPGGGGDVVFPPRRSSRRQDWPRTYRDKRAWQKRALLAQYLGRPVSPVVHLRNGADIKGASQELSEGQRMEVSVSSDLDEKTLFTRVLDFMGHVLLMAASGMNYGKGVLERARRLLGATGDHQKQEQSKTADLQKKQNTYRKKN